MMIKALFTLLFITTLGAYSQQLIRPESIEYDVKFNRLLITNKGNNSNGNKGFILQSDHDGTNLKAFSDITMGPLNAIEIVGDTVFVACEDGHVYGFNLETGQNILKWLLPGAEVPNGMSHYKKTLYVSDARKILYTGST